MSTPSSSIKTSTVIIASAGALVTGFLGKTAFAALNDWPSLIPGPSLIGAPLHLAYAVYFDHKRRTDPGFRKALKRESKREARAAKEAAEAQGAQQRQAIRNALDRAKDEGFPTEIEDKETYFMHEVGRGESLCHDESQRIEAATAFYKALKVYPQPRDLIGIYDKTVPKPVIDILAEMIALDPTISVSMSVGGSGPGSDRAIDD